MNREYLRFTGSDVRTNEVVTVDPDLYQVQPGELLIPWVVENDDRIALNYLRDGNQVSYSPPPLAPSAPVPNMRGFQIAIFNDMTILPAAKSQLILYFPLLTEHQNNPVYLQGSWLTIKMAGYDWLTPDLIEKVEDLASQFNVAII